MNKHSYRTIFSSDVTTVSQRGVRIWTVDCVLTNFVYILTFGLFNNGPVSTNAVGYSNSRLGVHRKELNGSQAINCRTELLNSTHTRAWLG